MAGRAISAAAGIALGAAVVLFLGGGRTTEARRPRLGPPRHQTARDMGIPPPVRPSRSRRADVLVWSPDGLPANTESVVEDIRGVGRATMMGAGLDWISRSRGPDGATVDAPPQGMAIPFETAAVDPVEYASFVPPSERDAVRALRPGQMLIARSEQDLRGAGAGLSITFSDRRVHVVGVVSNTATQGYEGLISAPVPPSWARVDDVVLAHARRGLRPRIRTRIRKLLGPGQVFNVKYSGETPFLRYADAVLPQMLVKKTFGEFAARPLPDGTIDVDPAWRNRYIRTRRVPILGEVTCHRALFPQLRKALQEVIAKNLAYTISPSQYGGCYGPRFIDRNPSGRLSHHAWGIAIDLNVGENAFGTQADQNQDLVRVMEDWGFTWGGRWLIPDGMHFEWSRWP